MCINQFVRLYVKPPVIQEGFILTLYALPLPTALTLLNKLPETPNRKVGFISPVTSLIAIVSFVMNYARVAAKLITAIVTNVCANLAYLFRNGYTFHANASSEGVRRAGVVCATPGHSIPNYTTSERAQK
jgi:hypothetical protein